MLIKAFQLWREARKWRRLERALKECYPHHEVKVRIVRDLRIKTVQEILNTRFPGEDDDFASHFDEQPH